MDDGYLVPMILLRYDEANQQDNFIKYIRRRVDNKRAPYRRYSQHLIVGTIFGSSSTARLFTDRNV